MALIDAVVTGQYLKWQRGIKTYRKGSEKIWNVTSTFLLVPWKRTFPTGEKIQVSTAARGFRGASRHTAVSQAASNIQYWALIFNVFIVKTSTRSNIRENKHSEELHPETSGCCYSLVFFLSLLSTNPKLSSLPACDSPGPLIPKQISHILYGTLSVISQNICTVVTLFSAVD